MIPAAVHFVTCMIVFSIVERFWPSSAPHRWWRRPLLLDICSWLIVPVAIGAGITLAILLTNALTQGEHLSPWLIRLRVVVGDVPLFVQFVVAFIAVDLPFQGAASRLGQVAYIIASASVAPCWDVFLFFPSFFVTFARLL